MIKANVLVCIVCHKCSVCFRDISLNLQWRNIQLAGNVNQTPNNTNSTTSNNKTSVEEVAQLDGKKSYILSPSRPTTTKCHPRLSAKYTTYD
jgi:hypothetical protein